MTTDRSPNRTTQQERVTVPGLQPIKPKILLAYISAELENIFTHDVAAAGYDVRAIPFKDLKGILDAGNWADGIFVQWDGRGQIAHDLFTHFNSTRVGTRRAASIYAVTIANIKITTMSPKASRQLNISGWFDMPNDLNAALSELSLLMPDEYDDFSGDLARCDFPLLEEIQLEQLTGKHLLGVITSAWNERQHRADTVTRVKDDILRSHVTFFHNDEARTNEIKSFLTDIRFKYHDEFNDITSCTRWIRGHGTDCLVIWYDAKNVSGETIIRLYTENRQFRRIPILILAPSEDDLRLFKRNHGDLFVDKFILFDRHREHFRLALIEAFEGIVKAPGTRKLLDELRYQALDFPPQGAQPLSSGEIDLACHKIEAEPRYAYWSDAEKLLSLAHAKDTTHLPAKIEEFSGKYKSFDALLTATIARCAISKQEALLASNQFVQNIQDLRDFNFDRLVRSSMTLARIGITHPLKTLLILWWQSKNLYPAEYEFYWAASRWASLSGFPALERTLLARAVKGDPLRNEYVESYANHLIATGHHTHAVELATYLTRSPYFPLKKSMMILFNAKMKADDRTGAAIVLAEMIVNWPHDRRLLALRQKSGFA